MSAVFSVCFRQKSVANDPVLHGDKEKNSRTVVIFLATAHLPCWQQADLPQRLIHHTQLLLEDRDPISVWITRTHSYMNHWLSSLSGVCVCVCVHVYGSSMGTVRCWETTASAVCSASPWECWLCVADLWQVWSECYICSRQQSCWWMFKVQSSDVWTMLSASASHRVMWCRLQSAVHAVFTDMCG